MKTTTTALPVMELQETLRRFTWLVGMLAVITTVTVLAHNSFDRLVSQRQEAGQTTTTTTTAIAPVMAQR